MAITESLGGAGEGKQHLHPDGSIQNQHQVKTDATLPAYCTPPNPCPIGYVGESTNELSLLSRNQA